MVISISTFSSRPLLAVEHKGYLSLILVAVSAERNQDIVNFKCEIILDNATSKEIQVISNFREQLDGIDIVVTNNEGEILAQQPFTYHLSPFSPTGEMVTIKKGKTPLTLRFPVSGLDSRIDHVMVRLAGQLQRSTYQRVCSSETKDLRVASGVRSQNDGATKYNTAK
jgi:hypothetical protein